LRKHPIAIKEEYPFFKELLAAKGFTAGKESKGLIPLVRHAHQRIEGQKELQVNKE